MKTRKKIIVVFGFDMETDSGSWTPFYEGLKHGTPLILKLLDRKGVTGTFFFTGESAMLHPGILKMAARQGHEVGCHSLYHETVGDPLFEIPGVKPLLKQEVFPRLQLTDKLVRKASGVRPVSFRCPRLWGSTEVVNSLEKLGYVADASYPLYFYGKRLAPYYPSRKDWTKEGGSKVLEIPNFADMTVKSTDTYHRDRDQWPLFRTKSAAALMKHINSFVKYASSKKVPAVVLCFYFHPWEFVKMPYKFTFGEGTVVPDRVLLKNCGPYAYKQFGILIDMLKGIGAEFVTAKSLAGQWKKLSRK